MPFEMSVYWVSFLVAPYYNVYPFELAKDQDWFQLERAELGEDGLLRGAAFPADLSGDPEGALLKGHLVFLRHWRARGFRV